MFELNVTKIEKMMKDFKCICFGPQKYLQILYYHVCFACRICESHIFMLYQDFFTVICAWSLKFSNIKQKIYQGILW
jgi:hypothetical protein